MIKNNKSLGGRKKGSRNVLSIKVKELLFEALEDDLKNLERLMRTPHPDEKIMHLKHFSGLIAKGNDPIAIETRKLIFEGLESHYKKMKLYFNHVPQQKKASELRQYIKLLPERKRESIIENLPNTFKGKNTLRSRK